MDSPFASFALYIVGIIAIMYIFVIRPHKREQQRKESERREMLDNLRKGVRVVTIGGVHGEVVSTKGQSVILRIDAQKDVRIKVAKAAVNRIQGPDSRDEDESGG